MEQSIKQLKTKFPNVRKWLNYLILYKTALKKTLLSEKRRNQYLTHLTQITVFIIRRTTEYNLFRDYSRSA